MYRYESRLKDWGKKVYPLLTNDAVDEMEQITINTNGANVIKASKLRMIADTLVKIRSSLESGALIFLSLEQCILAVDLPNQKIGPQYHEKAHHGLIDTSR